ASVHPSPLASQPLAVEEMRSRKLHADARATESCDCFLVELVRVFAVGEQRARASLDPERPVRAGCASCPFDALEGASCTLRLTNANRRLDQLGERPDRRALRVEGLARSGRRQSVLVAAE